MPDATPSEQLSEELAREVAILRDLAVRSIDPLVIAKAIAASDQNVQQLILARLLAGERLVEVLALGGEDPQELPVFFRFVPADPTVQLSDSGLLALVDSINGEVVNTVDPFTLRPESRAGQPFAIVSAPDVSVFAGTSQALVDRERAFLTNVGVAPGGGGGGGGSVGTTWVLTSATISPVGPGGKYKTDDTGREGSGTDTIIA